MRVFFDTNVLLYAIDADAGPRQHRAIALVEDALVRGFGVVSTQVLQEFYVNATRKLKLEPAIARRHVELLLKLEVIEVRTQMVLAAIDLQQARQLSFWDALVVKAASSAGCAQLLTEDLQHGATLDGVRVENPFRDLVGPNL